MVVRRPFPCSNSTCWAASSFSREPMPSGYLPNILSCFLPLPPSVCALSQAAGGFPVPSAKLDLSPPVYPAWGWPTSYCFKALLHVILVCCPWELHLKAQSTLSLPARVTEKLDTSYYWTKKWAGTEIQIMAGGGAQMLPQPIRE